MAIDRTKYFGGSDVAGVLGVSNWATPLDVYQRKVGQSAPTEYDEKREKILNRGKKLEPIVVQMLEDEYGIEVVERSTEEAPNRFTDPEHDFMKAEIDFGFRVTDKLLSIVPDGFIDPGLIGSVQNGEIKSVHPFAAGSWGEMFREEVPVYYAAQSMYGLMVTGRKLCLYGTLFGADDLTLYVVNRDEETIAGIRSKVLEFWFENVLPRIPPDPINMADITKLFLNVRGRPISCDAELAALLQELKTVRGKLKSDQETEETLEFQICDRIWKEWGTKNPEGETDDVRLMLGDQVLAKWNRTRGTHLDQKKLKLDHPDLVEQYTNEHWYRAFRFLKQK